MKVLARMTIDLHADGSVNVQGIEDKGLAYMLLELARDEVHGGFEYLRRQAAPALDPALLAALFRRPESVPAVPSANGTPGEGKAVE